MTFKYDKENLFKEFEAVKQKDIALSKLSTLEAKENDYYTNRIIINFIHNIKNHFS